MNAAGKTTVNIAPVTASGISHNTYQAFNVPKAGVDLNNTKVSAQTIINQVTSNQRSLLEGKLEVLGAPANVIVANPNGITVNGGSFVNTAGLVLTTGSVGFVDRQITPFLLQKNALITTSKGDIQIGPDGLSGMFTNLVLAARQISIKGPVASSSDATIQLIAGGSQMELDSLVVPNNSNNKPWLQVKPYNTGSTAEILVDITRPASLTASNIKIAVTEHGAGVRMAGTAMAGAGDFYLASNGQVQLNGAEINAKGHIVVESQDQNKPAPTIVARGDEQGFALSAGGQVQLLADAIDMEHGKIQSATGDVVLGRKGVDATDDFRFVGVEAGDGIVSGAGIGLYAQGKKMTLQNLQVGSAKKTEIAAADIAVERIPLDGKLPESWLRAASLDLAATGSVRLSTEIRTTQDDLWVRTHHAVQIEGATLTAAGNLRVAGLDAEQPVPTLVAKDGAAGDFSLQAAGNLELLVGSADLQHGAITTQKGDVVLGLKDRKAAGDFRLVDISVNSGDGLGLYAAGQDVYLQQFQANVAQASQVQADNFTLIGQLIDNQWQASAFRSLQLNLQASGAVLVKGSELSATQDLVLDSGRLQVIAAQSPSGWQPAKIVAQNGGLLVYARNGGIDNQGSLLQGGVAINNNPDSHGGVTLYAKGDILNQSLDANTLAMIFASGEDQGDLWVQTQGNLTNQTGRLISNSNVQLNVAGKLYNGTAHTNPPQYAEKVYYKHKSGWFIFRRTVSGWYYKLSDLTMAGQLGYILAGKNVYLNAASVENDGGEIDANGGDIRINTGNLVNTAVASGYAWWERSSYLFWQRDKGDADMRIDGGKFSAAGDLLVNATGSVANHGGQLLSLGNLTIQAQQISGTSMTLMQRYSRDDGMREIWSGEYVRILESPVGGSFISWGGKVNLLTPGTVEIYGGTVQAADGVNTPGGLHIVTPPPSIQHENYGFLDFLF